MAKQIKPLDQQIEEYKLQFELYLQMKQWFINNPEPEHKRLPTDKNDMDVVLRYPSYQAKWDDWFKLYWHEKQRLVFLGWKEYEWNWDDNWDGQLIKDVQALERVGFTIVSFSRKRKVTLKDTLEPYEWYDLSDNAYIVNMIDSALKESDSLNYYSISFKPTLSIYWKGRSSKWNG